MAGNALRVLSFIIAAMMLVTTGMAAADENASNPLAAANNVDLRWQYTSADAGNKHDAYIDGAYLVLPELNRDRDVPNCGVNEKSLVLPGTWRTSRIL